MKVTLVVDRFDAAAGGLEQWTVGFAGFLAARGHAVHAVAFGAGAHALPVAVHVLPDPGGILGRARLVARCVAGLAADAVLDTGTGWSGDVFMPCTGSRRASQARLVATHPPLLRWRAALSPRSRLLAWQMAWLERRQVRRARHVVAVSGAVRDLLAAQHGIGAERVSVIPNGVDTARFAGARLAALRPGARAALGAGTATLFLGSAHNMHLKGMDTAIRALARLHAAGADVRLAIAGGTPDPFWTGLAGQLGVGGRVAFLGWVADTTPLFAAADAFVHPTRWDACSLSTIEAGAAGLPAITTTRNGAAALIEDGATGFVLADPEDVPALADRMGRLLDPALRARLGAAARAASAGHDLARNHAAVEAVLLRFSRAARMPAAAGP